MDIKSSHQTSTPVPNWILENPLQFTRLEMGLILFIIQRGVANGTRSSEICSISCISKALNYHDQDNIRQALKKLISKKIIVRIKQKNSFQYALYESFNPTSQIVDNYVDNFSENTKKEANTTTLKGSKCYDRGVANGTMRSHKSHGKANNEVNKKSNKLLKKEKVTKKKEINNNNININNNNPKEKDIYIYISKKKGKFKKFSKVFLNPKEKQLPPKAVLEATLEEQKIFEVFKSLGFSDSKDNFLKWIQPLYKEQTLKYVDFERNAYSWRDYFEKKHPKNHKLSYRNWIYKPYAIKRDVDFRKAEILKSEADKYAQSSLTWEYKKATMSPEEKLKINTLWEKIKGMSIKTF